MCLVSLVEVPDLEHRNTGSRDEAVYAGGVEGQYRGSPIAMPPPHIS